MLISLLTPIAWVLTAPLAMMTHKEGMAAWFLAAAVGMWMWKYGKK
jgi:hypothetical protein